MLVRADRFLPLLMPLLLLITSLVLLSLVDPALAQRPASDGAPRLALVIGNADYKSGPLANPVNDARAMAERLREFGFHVTLHENLRTRQIGSVYREFRSKIVPGATALVFYAGHGVQVKGQNYFPAVDAEISSEEDVPLQSLHLGTLLENMDEAKAGVSLVFLDACRDNPFARRFRSGSSGLAKVEAASGTLIHYATRPGSVADDGDGRNGTYTDALLREMGAPGLPVELMLKQVTNQVVAKTRGKQEPWIEGSLRGDFYFNGKSSTSGAAGPVVAVGPAVAANPVAEERAVWDTVKFSRNADEIRAYLARFPNGLFARVAQARLNALSATPAPVESAAPNAAATQPAAAAGLIAAMTPGTVFRDCARCPEMVVIPPGSFVMGSPASEDKRRGNEGPQHRVDIARPFAAGKFELTFDEWDFCVEEGGCPYRPSDEGWGRGRQPVTNVSWQDAKTYTEWLSRKTGHRYGLPSEAMWEYAARAGTKTAFSTGAQIAPQQANYDSARPYAGSAVAPRRGRTAPVGSYAANPFGLFDVHGNVYEWTEDCNSASYEGAPNDGSSRSSGDCSRRMLRGGSWSNFAEDLRSAFRDDVGASYRNNHYLGFRVFRTDPVTGANTQAPPAPVSQAMTPAVQPAPAAAVANAPAPTPPLASMKPGTVFRDCPDCPEMVVIPAGRFIMGSPPTEQGRWDGEGPQHPVNIPKPLAMGKFEVTRAQFARFVEEAGHETGRGCTIFLPVPKTPPPHPPLRVWDDPARHWRSPGYAQSETDPVACVNWNDARAYLEWLSRKSGQRYRLPTEAEWEYAARAGTTTAFSSGARITPKQANYYTPKSYAGSPVAPAREGTAPVGSYPANAFGLHDMHGNLWEWTEDCWNKTYHGAPADGSAWISGDCSARMLRGGFWGDHPRQLRSAMRFVFTASSRNQDYGFRVVRSD